MPRALACASLPESVFATSEKLAAAFLASSNWSFSDKFSFFNSSSSSRRYFSMALP